MQEEDDAEIEQLTIQFANQCCIRNDEASSLLSYVNESIFVQRKLDAPPPCVKLKPVIEAPTVIRKPAEDQKKTADPPPPPPPLFSSPPSITTTTTTTAAKSKLKATNLCAFLATLNLPEAEISKYRKKIEADMVQFIGGKDKQNAFEVTVQLMEALWNSYDRHFFKGKLKRTLEKAQHKLLFKINNRMTSTAGRCFLRQWNDDKQINEYKFEIASKLFKETFKQPDDPPLINNGITCRNRVQCLMLTFEHEFVHALIFMFDPPAEITKKKDSQHPELFIRLAKSLFGHTKVTHSLKH